MTTTKLATVANLRDSRKAMAAAKKRHPASATPAKPAKATTATPAKATTAKPAASNATPAAARKSGAAKSGAAKMRWTVVDAETREMTGVVGDTVYKIVPVDGGFKVVVRQDGQSTVLVDGVSGGRAYQAAVRHHHG